MNRPFALIVAVLLVVLGVVVLGTPAAQADTMAVSVGSSTNNSASGFSVGYEFTISQTILVTMLGVFDQDDNGTLGGGERKVVIYSAATGHALVASATVWDTAHGYTKSSQFFWSNSLDQGSTVTLSAGKYEILVPIGGSSGLFAGEYRRNAANATWSSPISWVQACYSALPGTQLGIPAYPTTWNGVGSNPDGYFGPNFQFTIANPPANIYSTGTSSTWTTSGQWDIQVPTNVDTAIIDNTDSHVEVNTTGTTAVAYILYVKQGSLTVDSGDQLNIGTDTFVQGGTVTLAGKLVTGTLQQSGGTVTLSGTGAGDRISDTAAVTISGGTFDLGNSSETVGAVTLSGSAAITGTGTLTGTSYTLTSGTISSTVTLAGSGSTLTMNGSGTVTLAGTNTYTGLTTVSAGTLQLGATGAIGSGALTVSGTGTLDLNGYSPTLGAVTLSGGSIIGTTTLIGTSYTLNSGTISSTVTLGDKSGGGSTLTIGGTFTLYGTHTYSGLTTISSGMLTITTLGPINSTSGITVSVSSNATFALDGTMGSAITKPLTLRGGGGVGNLGDLRNISGTNEWSGTVSVINGYSSNTYIGVDDSADTLTISGVISGSSNANLKKVGAGTLVLSGNSTYGCQTYVLAGTLSFNSIENVSSSTASALGKPTTVANGTINIGSTTTSATLQYTGAGHSSDRVINLAGTTGGATIEALGSGALTLSGGVTSTGSGSKTLTLNGTSTYANTIGAIADNTPSTPTAVLKTGAGTWILSGFDTYTGGTTVQAGTLKLGALNRLADTGALTVSGGTFDLSTWSDTVGAVTLTSGEIKGPGTLTASSYAVSSGTISANLAGTSASLTKTTSSTVVLSGAGTYYGTTTVSLGTLRVSGSLSAVSDISVAGGGTLDVTSTGSISLNNAPGVKVNVAGGGFLTGSGVVGLYLCGDGLVSPGNSPGILTATLIGPSTGLDFAFEFTHTGSPDYTNASNSINDVLRLTSATPFYSESLDGDNVINVYFNLTTLPSGIYQGGFYTDLSSAFLASIEGATYNYYFLGNGSGTYDVNGAKYYKLLEYAPGTAVSLSTVDAGYHFTGTANGYVTQFAIGGGSGSAIPEPAALGLIGLVLLALRGRCSPY